MVVQASAKAEAAKARAAFAVKEEELKIETARLQATLEAMQEEKEMNDAIAEAEILEAGLLESEYESHKSAPSPVSLDQRLQRTADYVHDRAHVESIQQPPRTDEKVLLSICSQLSVKRHATLMLVNLINSTRLQVESP